MQNQINPADSFYRGSCIDAWGNIAYVGGAILMTLAVVGAVVTSPIWGPVNYLFNREPTVRTEPRFGRPTEGFLEGELRKIGIAEQRRVLKIQRKAGYNGYHEKADFSDLEVKKKSINRQLASLRGQAT